MARIHRIVRDLDSFSHADDDAKSPMDVNLAIESALTMLRNELKYRARVERDLRADAAGAGQRGAAGAGVPEPDPQRGAGARRGRPPSATSSGCAAATTAMTSSSRWRTTARHRARGHAAHLRVVLHHQAARGGDRARAADLARDRARPGRRDRRSRAAGQGATVPRPAAGGARGAPKRPRARRSRRPSGDSDPAGGSWPSTTRRCCSRPTAACWSTAHELVDGAGRAARRCGRSSATPPSTSSCVTCRCRRCRGWSFTPRCADATRRWPSGSSS